MKLFKILFAIFAFMAFLFSGQAQVYHYMTGEIIPDAKHGQLRLKKGIFQGYDSEYGVLIVKENRHERDSRLINIPVIIVHSFNDHPKEPVFLLNGGPGASNIWERNFPDFLLDNHPIVMIGYRGVDGSVCMSCPEVRKTLLNCNMSLASEDSIELIHSWENCFSRFRKDMIDIRGYIIEEVVDDIECVRTALDYENINLFSYSFGTIIGQFFMLKYPENVHASILIGTRPLGHYFHNSAVIEKRLNKFYKHWINSSENTRDSVLSYAVVSETFRNIGNHQKINMNKDRLMLLFFRSLYSYSETANLIDNLLDYAQGDIDAITKFCEEFENTFFKDIMLGDYAVKISSCFSNNYPEMKLDSNNHLIGASLAVATNKWNNLMMSAIPSDFICNYPELADIQINTLFINGEYDFISPEEELREYLYPVFNNYSVIKARDLGHEDLISKGVSENIESISCFFTDEKNHGCIQKEKK